MLLSMKIQGLFQLLCMDRYLVALQMPLGTEDSCIKLAVTAEDPWESRTLPDGQLKAK